MTTTTNRLDTANAALAIFARTISLYRDLGRVGVQWPNYGRDKDKNPVHRRIWQSMTPGSFYPKWSRHFCHGGTVTTALCMLVRWVRRQPVVAIGTWRYWCGKNIRLADDRGEELAELLLAGGWPEIAECVLCDCQLTRGHDWWSLDGVSGPVCNYGDELGCRQKVVRS